MDGHFHRIIWFCEYPCVDTNSETVLENMRLHTCDPVSMDDDSVPVLQFQNLMHLSAVPPPDASNPCWCGDHASALTAAVCWLNFYT